MHQNNLFIMTSIHQNDKKKNINLMFFQTTINLGRYIIGSVIAVMCVCVCVLSYRHNLL